MTATVRRAIVADHVWIASLLRSGASDGHFHEQLGQQAPAMLQDIAARGAITMWKARNEQVVKCTVRCDVWVVEWSGAPAAFLLCMEHPDGYELNLSATRPEYRRRGCFDALVAHAIEKAPPALRIYARCYKPSIAAMVALQRRGFVITQPGDPDELTLQQPAVALQLDPALRESEPAAPDPQPPFLQRLIARLLPGG